MHAEAGVTVFLTGLLYLQSQLSCLDAESYEVFELLHLIWVLVQQLGVGAKSFQEYGPGFDWFGLYNQHTNKQFLHSNVCGIENKDCRLQQSYIMDISYLIYMGLEI